MNRNKNASVLSLTLFLFALIGLGGYFFIYDVDRVNASWHSINVNSGYLQGDANLIIHNDRVIMIDAGYKTEAKKDLLPYLKKLNIKHIDHFFISHPHRDHYEGLAAIIDSGITVEKVYYKLPADEIKDCCYNKNNFLEHLNFAKDHGAQLIQPKTGFKLTLSDRSSIEILHAQEGNLPDKNIDVNDLSLIMKWEINNVSVLFTGDLNQAVGEVLTSDIRMRADFLKAPHHGTASLAADAYFDAVDPTAMIVPGPTWLWCDNRSRQLREWAKARDIPVWVNGLNGNVKVEFLQNKTVVTPQTINGKCKARAFGEKSFY